VGVYVGGAEVAISLEVIFRGRGGSASTKRKSNPPKVPPKTKTRE